MCVCVLASVSPMGAGTAAALLWAAPRPAVTTPTTRTDGPAPPAQSDSDGKLDDWVGVGVGMGMVGGKTNKKDRQNEFTLPTWLQLFVFVRRFSFVLSILNCTLFCFIVYRFSDTRHRSSLLILLLLLLLFVC